MIHIPHPMTITPADPAGRLFQRIVKEADDYADRIGGDRFVAYLHQIGALYAAYRVLGGELDAFKGVGAKPQAGCTFFTATAGDASVLVEYEYDPGEASQTSGPPERCYEGHPASVSIIQALVNGKWCDPTDVFSAELIERWSERIAESEDEQAREQREGAERDRYDDAKDFA